MHADYTRILRDRRYDAVLTQQGRVQLDSDTNESQLVALDHRRTAAIDALGPAAAPKLDAGFAISAAAGGDLSISPGSFVLRGIRVRNTAPSLRAAQPFLPDARPLADLLPVGAAALVYLHAWHRHITADQDPSIRESALGGPDTTTRLQPLWQVGVLPVPLNQFAPNLPAPSDAAGVSAAAEALRRLAAQGLDIPLAAWHTLIPPLEDPRRGWLTASTDTPGPDDNPCELPPTSGYRGLENHLYRIEIHTPGDRTAATFKWSRDNGSFTVPIIEHVAPGRYRLATLGPDQPSALAPGQLVELIDDRRELLNLPGPLLRVSNVDPAERRVDLTIPGTLDPAELDATDASLHPRLRRWDHPAEADTELPLDSTSLERGLRVAFSDGLYTTGDYWLIPARHATGSIDWPPPLAPNMPTGRGPSEAPPFGAEHAYTPLAVVLRTATGLVIADARPIAPPTAFIEATDVSFDDSNCAFDADTVQEAIEALCARGSGGGLCSAVVRPGEDAHAIVAQIPAAADFRLCFAAGEHVLPRPLDFRGNRHISVIGAGPMSNISCPSGEAVLRFTECASVTVRDLSARSGRAGTPSEGFRNIHGAITCLDCDDVVIQSVTARCPGGPERSAASIVVRYAVDESTATRNSVNGGVPNPALNAAEQRSAEAAADNSSVLIRDCRCLVGDRQIAILLVNAGRIDICSNDARVVASSKQTSDFSRGSKHTAGLSKIIASKLAVSDPGAPATPGANVRLTVAGRVVEFTTRADFSTRTQQWNALFAAGAPALGSSRAVVERFVSSRLQDLFDPRSKVDRAVSLAFDQLVAAARQGDDAYAAQGITIAGRAARDIRVRDNLLHDVAQGIHIAFSFRVQPENTRVAAEDVHITGNRIHLLLPRAARTDSHGILLGSANSACIRDNRIDLTTPGGKASDFIVEGIRVAGAAGIYLSITNNLFTSCDLGVSLDPFSNDPTPAWPHGDRNNRNNWPLWVVEDNLARSASTALKLHPGVLDVERRLDAQVVRRTNNRP
jgi:hypothetical protein